MPSKDTTEKLKQLRASMKKLNLEAYIVYSEDAHGSEYIAESDKRRAFISNFTGSAGTAVITSSKAALWTDGRYYLQASQQLDSNWTLMKDRLPETPSIQDWLVTVLPSNSRVGLDPTLVSLDAAKKLEETFEPKGHKLVSVNDNLIDAVWTDKPSCPSGKVFAHPIEFSGQSHQDKFTKIREHLEKEDCQALAVSALDEIAWLFNLRGSDIDYNPVFISYAVLGKNYATLYVDSSKISKEVLDHLGSVVQIKPYNDVFADLKNLNAQKQKVWIDSSKSSLAISSCVDAALTVTKPSPITLAKALKNEAELAGLRACHLRDAAALVNYFSWLEERLESGDDSLNECNVADKVDSLRSEQSDFVSLSFDTISSSGPNGAIIHYKPQPESCAKVVKNQLYLCDSGGQYKDGTTDVTRTLHFGTPTQHEKNSFTRVLKGVISLDSAVFPRGTTGRELDILARMHLWEAGLDYRHGTGHGVGAFLNVHEGPQSISFRDPPYKVPMEPGMTVTNEPGYYEDGAFGIRIENVMAVKEVNTEFNFGEKGYLGFEHMTYVPIQTKMIEISLMNKKDIEWVNNYHKECLEKVAPLVQGKALEWLKRETQAI